MGKYLDILESINISAYNSSFDIKNDTITQMIDTSKERSGSIFSISALLFIGAVVFLHIIKQENGFNLTTLQAVVSTNAILLSFAIMFVYLGILANIQVFIWSVLLLFLAQVWAVLRTTN